LKDGDGEYGLFPDGDDGVFIDKTVEFEQHIAPLITKVMEASREHGVPVILMAVYAHNGENEKEGFGMAGGVVGSMHHMPLPMLVAAGTIEDQVRDALQEARRTYISAALTGDALRADSPHANSLWRHALAAEMIDNGEPAVAERDLDRRIAVVMDAFEGLAGIVPDSDMGTDSGIDIRND
jgi:hypothetical protein